MGLGVTRDVLALLAVAGPAEGLLLATLTWAYMKVLHGQTGPGWPDLCLPGVLMADLMLAGECFLKVLKSYHPFIGVDCSLALLVLLYLVVLLGGCVFLLGLRLRDSLGLGGVMLVLHLLFEHALLGISAPVWSVLEVS
jgi:hypothetical protein